jgi:chromosome segregation ATPase
MPKKILTEPDDSQYHLDNAKLDEQFEKVKEEFKDLVAEQHSTRALMKTG